MDQYSVFDALNLAISPVIMISAYGMLLLSLTNRLGRAIDRARALVGESGASRQFQIEILAKRARRIRAAILAVSLAMFFAAVLVLVLFLSVFAHVDLKLAVSALFVASLVSLIFSLACLIADVFGSLKAMEAELRG
ncbi:MAG: hypothetical protein RIQ71_1589 [Verrucomicrobiota bacterium]